MSGFFEDTSSRSASASRRPPGPRPLTPVQAAQPLTPSTRNDVDVASLAAFQQDRYTRRKGRALSMLTGTTATGGIGATRTLGAATGGI